MCRAEGHSGRRNYWGIAWKKEEKDLAASSRSIPSEGSRSILGVGRGCGPRICGVTSDRRAGRGARSAFSFRSPFFRAGHRLTVFRSRPFRLVPSPPTSGLAWTLQSGWVTSRLLSWVLIVSFSLRSRPQHAFVLEGFPADSHRDARRLHRWVLL